MLHSLYVKHYALIEEISVDFERGLNIITGETGAGKSILIDALSLLLGERASADVVRKGAEKAIVEGAFDCCRLAENSIPPERQRHRAIGRNDRPPGNFGERAKPLFH